MLAVPLLSMTSHPVTTALPYLPLTSETVPTQASGTTGAAAVVEIGEGCEAVGDSFDHVVTDGRVTVLNDQRPVIVVKNQCGCGRLLYRVNPDSGPVLDGGVSLGFCATKFLEPISGRRHLHRDRRSSQGLRVRRSRQTFRPTFVDEGPTLRQPRRHRHRDLHPECDRECDVSPIVDTLA
ncbi:MAG: hypothetical protein QOJ66_3283 [Ilumatobacteraceae bacterium]